MVRVMLMNLWCNFEEYDYLDLKEDVLCFFRRFWMRGGGW